MLRAADGTPLMTIVADDVGNHDTIAGACSKESNTLRYGHHTVHQHACAENFLAEGAKWGLGKRDIVSNINFFMNVPVEADGTLGIVDGLSAPGKSLTLRAESDTLVLVSNCPQINNPCNGFDPTPVRMVISRLMTAIEVVRPGMLTTVQDWPGRIGYWHVGVPPSGPMDDLSFRIGNRVLGNPEGVAGLECTRGGPALRFPDGGRVCVTGAPVARDDGRRAGAAMAVGHRPCRWSARRRHADRPGNALLRAGGRRPAGTRIPRQHSDIHAWRVRRPRRPPAARRRRADGRRRPGTTQRPSCARSDRRAAQHRAPLGGRGHRGPARRAGVLHPRRHRDAGRHRLHRALQLRSHRCAPGGPEAAVGAQRRRRGGPASVEHPRQRLLRRHFGLHRRHPDPARPRRTEPWRVRLPGHRGRRRPLEARPDGAGGRGAVRSGARRPGAVAGAPSTSTGGRRFLW